MKQSSNPIQKLVMQKHSKPQTIKIINRIGEDQKSFDQLMHLFLGKDTELARRASWPLSYVVSAHPELIRKWLPAVLRNLKKENQHPAIYRNTFRFLQEVKIPNSLSPTTFDLALKYILNASYPGAIRAFAITTAWNASNNVPELHKEIQLVLEQVMKEDSPAIRSRGRLVLKKHR